MAATLSIFDRKTLVVLGLVSFGLALVLLVTGAVLPGVFGQPVSRGFLLVACTLLLSVFLWLIFPQKLELTRIPLIDVGLQMAGPPVLFIVLLLLLNQLLPTALSSTRYYQVRCDGDGSVPLDVIRFDGAASHNKLIPITDPNRFDALTGLVAKFDDLQPFEVELSGEKVGGKPAIRTQTVKFEPGMKTLVITLSR